MVEIGFPHKTALGNIKPLIKIICETFLCTPKVLLLTNQLLFDCAPKHIKDMYYFKADNEPIHFSGADN